MCNIEGNKRICILDNLFDCRQPHQHIHLNEKKQISKYTNSKLFLSEKKLPLEPEKTEVFEVYVVYLFINVGSFFFFSFFFFLIIIFFHTKGIRNTEAKSSQI